MRVLLKYDPSLLIDCFIIQIQRARSSYHSGSTTSPTQANGIYMCYQGGLQVEEGEWNLSRSSSEAE